MNSVFTLMLVIFYIFTDLQAKDFLVDTVKALHASMKKVEGGDVIIMKDGIWSDVNIVFKVKGNKKVPIILRPEHQGKVIISGKSSLVIRGDYLVVDGLIFKNGQPAKTRLITFGTKKKPVNFSRLTNTEIIAFNDKNLSKRYDWVSIIGGSHNRVDHCRFTQMKNKGVTLNVRLLDNAPANYHRIDHNEFSYRMYGKGKNGYETIRVGDSVHSLQNSRTTVRDNLFIACNGEIEIISNKSCENNYIHNTFRNSKGMLTLRHGNRCLVKDNFFFADGNKQMGGIRIIGEGHNIVNNYFEGVGSSPYRAAISFMNGIPNPPLYEYTQVKDCNITHNKLINTKYSIVTGANYKNGKYPLPPIGVVFNNNLIVGVLSPLIRYKGKIKPDIVYLGNIAFGAKCGINIKEGIHIKDPKLIKDTQSRVWISNIGKVFQEYNILPISLSDVGPLNE